MYVTGYGCNAGCNTYSAITVSYDSQGNHLWTQLFKDGLGFALAVGPDGKRLYVVGDVGPPGPFSRVCYLVIDYETSDGGMLWSSANRDCQGGEYASAVAAPNGGRIFVTGTAGYLRYHPAYGTLAFSPKGRLIWNRSYSGRQGGLQASYSIAVGPGGRQVYVTGFSQGIRGWDYATVAYRT